MEIANSASNVSASSLAAALELRQAGPGRWRGGCPVCGGTSRFSLTDKDGKTLMFCFAGCTQDAIITELRARAAWPERPRQEFTEAERREYGRRRRAAEAEARELLAWREEMLNWMRGESIEAWRRFRDARQRIQERGLGQRGGGWWASRCEQAEAWGECLDRLRDRVQAASWAELLVIFRATKRQSKAVAA